MSCPDCIKGSLDEGTPRGEEIVVEGIPCYLSKPTTSNGAAIILGTDIFGYKLVNARLIADVFADAGYTVAVPDYFKGEPMDMAVLETFESLPSRNIFSKIGAVLWLLTKMAGMVRNRAQTTGFGAHSPLPHPITAHRRY
jgi:dienelactone hydrolase